MSRLSARLVAYWLFFMLLNGFQTVKSKSKGDGGNFGDRTQWKSERVGIRYPGECMCVHIDMTVDASRVYVVSFDPP